jgi:Xaa-Pro aminopeptidase
MTNDNVLVNFDRLQAILVQAGIDSLAIRMGENILASTGYWPVWGISCAVLTEGNAVPTLVLPRREQEFVPADYPGQVITFEPDQDADGPEAALVKRVKPLLGRRVGYDTPGVVVAANNTAGETRVPSPQWAAAITPSNTSAVDCTNALAEFRAIKTPLQVELIRRSQRFALNGLRRALEGLLTPGTSEIQLAARIEAEIEEQLGIENTKRVRAFAFVQAGLNSTIAADLISISGAYHLQAGDLVVVELGTVVDGYWSDLTRTVSVGPSPHAHLIQRAQAAQQAALNTMRPGVVAREVDAAARKSLDDYERFFTHNLGHGVGFAYHEPPTLNATSTAVLNEGMVVTVEPGVYVPGEAGARWEDNVAVTATGFDVLSKEAPNS